MKKTENKTRRTAAQESDYVTNRVLTVFAGGILLLIFATYLKNGLSYASSFTTALGVAQGSIWAGLVLALAGLVFTGRQLAKGTYKSTTLFNGNGLLMLGLLLSLCGYLMVDFGPQQALRALYVIIPVWAILYLIYSVYPREFFTIATAMTLQAAFLWLVAKSAVSNSFSSTTGVFLALGLVVCAALEGLYLATRSNQGRLKWGKMSITVFNHDTKHALVATVAVVGAVLLLAAFFLGGSVGYYAMYAVAAVLFLMAVYYTARMM